MSAENAEPTIVLTGGGSARQYTVPVSAAKTVYTDPWGITRLRSNATVYRSEPGLTYQANEVCFKETVPVVLLRVAESEAEAKAEKAKAKEVLDSLFTTITTGTVAVAGNGLNRTEPSVSKTPTPTPDLNAIVEALREHSDVSSELAEAIISLQEAQAEVEEVTKRLDAASEALTKAFGN